MQLETSEDIDSPLNTLKQLVQLKFVKDTFR